ncbi:MAG: hypothetical protein R3183_13970 [Oleiphilaceae bacterium]|nr:hypothetical protein [Oleiphilaceae bacterium]
MQSFITIIAITLIALLIWNSRLQPSGHEKACLDALLKAIKKNRDIKAREIAAILRSYGFDIITATQVTRMIKPRLASIGIRPEEQADVLHEIGRAKHYLELRNASSTTSQK